MTQLTQPAQTIPADLAQGTTKRRNFKFLLAGGLVIAVIVALIVQATLVTGAYYLTVSEVQTRAPTIYGERVRVNGIVVDGSEDWDPEAVTLRFTIADENQVDVEVGESTVNNSQLGDAAQLDIVFFGPRPDNFHRAASAIIEGEMLPDGTFQADTLLLSCPSRYEEEPEEIFVRAER